MCQVTCLTAWVMLYPSWADFTIGRTEILQLVELGSTWTPNLSTILHCPGDRDMFSKEWGSAATAAAVMLKIDQRDDDK